MTTSVAPDEKIDRPSDRLSSASHPHCVAFFLKPGALEGNMRDSVPRDWRCLGINPKYPLSFCLCRLVLVSIVQRISTTGCGWVSKQGSQYSCDKFACTRWFLWWLGCASSVRISDGEQISAMLISSQQNSYCGCGPCAWCTPVQRSTRIIGGGKAR